MVPLVVKLGGVVLDDKLALSNLFSIISHYKKEAKRPIIIVHGGGRLVDLLMDKLALPVKRQEGLRITPSDQIDIIVGALAGSANKTLLAEAKKHKIKSIGLCLADGNSVHVKQISQSLGHVANAMAGDPTLMELLIKADYVPIFSSIGITDSGDMMNVNADYAAVAVAKTMDADLILLSDVVGVLDQDKKRIASLTRSEADHLILDGIITDGMKIKVNSAFDAAAQLGKSIVIASWKETDKLIPLFNGDMKVTGTQIVF